MDEVRIWTSDLIAIKAIKSLRVQKTLRKSSGEIEFMISSYSIYELACTNLALIWAGVEKI